MLVLVVPFLVDKRAFAREEREAIALVVHVKGEVVPAGREGRREGGRQDEVSACVLMTVR